jgi:hypothetical protein
MSKFEKGREKTGGRAKGTPNKTSAEIKEAIQAVLSLRVDELDDDLEKMDKYKKWTILNAVTKYILPTYNKNEESVEHSGEIKISISFEDDTTSTKNNDNDDWMSI